MLRTIRIALAAIFFVGLTCLLLDFTGTVSPWVGWMARLQLLPALLAAHVGVVVWLVVLTVVCGRIYCSTICPMGVMQDVISWVAGKCWPDKKKRRLGRFRYTTPRVRRWVRGGVFVLFVVSLVLGLGSVVQLLAPYSAWGRIMQTLFQPLYMAGNNALADWAASHDSYAFYHVDVWPRSAAVLTVAVVTLVVVGVTAWVSGRGYCNNICPVGTLLGLLSRRSLLGIRLDAGKCRHCGACSRTCKGSALDIAGGKVDLSRCVVCGDCLEACRFDALHYSLSLPGGRTPAPGAAETSGPASSAGQPSQGPTRRALLTAAGTIALGAAVRAAEKTTDGGLAIITDKKAPQRRTAIVPPGALSLRNIQKRCTGCQLCVSKCPNGVLRPSGDLWHLAMPVSSYERGWCRPECHRCSDVCPAGAIVPLDQAYGIHPAAEGEGAEAGQGTSRDALRRGLKASVKIGTAVWVKENCIPLTDGVACGNCARHCPSQAIKMVLSDPEDKHSLRVPAVDEERCIGCGACEHLCPARPFSAIYVEGIEVHRQK